MSSIRPSAALAGPALAEAVHGALFAAPPAAVAERAALLLLDLAGVAAAGSLTPLSRIIRDHAARHFGATAGGARMLVDGRRVSPAGAALAGGMTIDSMDAHDGHALTKGHVGVAVLPALLAFADDGVALDGRGFLGALVLGYEVGTRAGIALHGTAPDYHTSGAWNALACAAIGARLLRLDPEATRHALGIAEYHGPRSQMMRCIEHPTMLKDGSGWGAMAGVTAALLAADGFTGAPAVTAESPAVAELWADLGRRWRLLEQYVKLYPVCRWAQPAVEACLRLQRQFGFAAADIARIEVTSFHAATRLTVRHPRSTEEAQYSLAFPVAAALVRGRLGAEEVLGEALADPEIARLSAATALVESPTYSERFPAERWAHATVTLKDGRVLGSAPTTARGDPDTPVDPATLRAKFHELADPVLGRERAARIERRIEGLPAADAAGVGALIEDLVAAP